MPDDTTFDLDSSSDDSLSVPLERSQPKAPPACSAVSLQESILRFLSPHRETDNPERLRRFTVRCEGRWNLRDAPTFASNILGTIAPGTVVWAEDSPTDGLDRVSSTPTPAEELYGVHPTTVAQAMQSITSLWVRVAKIEPGDLPSVGIKNDFSYTGQLYCLRRNDEGHGLYESSLEPLEGPFILLPDHLVVELRLDAARLKTSNANDVSLTWKLLDAADCLGNLFSPPAIDQEVINEEIAATSESPSADIFELRQQEQLKKAALSFRAPLEKLIAKAATDDCTGHSDLFAGLQGEIRRRFARLRVSFAAAARAIMVSVDPRVESSDGPGCLAEGSSAELAEFVHLCERLERTGGLSWLSQELRTEVMSFSAKHARDLHDYAIIYCKNPTKAMQPSSPSRGILPRTLSRPLQSPTTRSSLGHGILPRTLSQALQSPTQSSPDSPEPEARALPFLPPPPAPFCRVGTIRDV